MFLEKHRFLVQSDEIIRTRFFHVGSSNSRQKRVRKWHIDQPRVQFPMTSAQPEVGITLQHLQWRKRAGAFPVVSEWAKKCSYEGAYLSNKRCDVTAKGRRRRPALREPCNRTLPLGVI